ncbi:MAG: hypothetical protein ACR2L1_10895 [Pyrinomonadaceae bacterium]
MDRMQNTSQKENSSVASQWIKRFGVFGFMFFLIKGLLWLIVPSLLAYFAW